MITEIDRDWYRRAWAALTSVVGMDDPKTPGAKFTSGDFTFVAVEYESRAHGYFMQWDVDRGDGGHAMTLSLTPCWREWDAIRLPPKLRTIP